MSPSLTTVEAVVESIGRARLYEITGLSPQSVTNALRDNRLHARLYLLIQEELKPKGLSVDPALFGMAVPPSRAAGERVSA